LPNLLKRALDYIPPAVLAAMVAPEFINYRSPNRAVIAAGLTAALVAVLTKRDFTAILLGFIVYLIIAGLTAN
jgi:branched-subunit amino acid transport protein